MMQGAVGQSCWVLQRVAVAAGAGACDAEHDCISAASWVQHFSNMAQCVAVCGSKSVGCVCICSNSCSGIQTVQPAVYQLARLESQPAPRYPKPNAHGGRRRGTIMSPTDAFLHC